MSAVLVMDLGKAQSFAEDGRLETSLQVSV